LVWQTIGGVTISPRLRVGLDITSWDRWDPPVSSSAQATNMTVDVIVLPSRTLAGPNGKVGVGLSDADLWNETLGRLDHAWGFGATVGIGYGLRFAGTDYLNLRLGWMFQAFPRGPGRPSSSHTLAISVGVTSP
jgi:hypothetical protein